MGSQPVETGDADALAEILESVTHLTFYGFALRLASCRGKPLPRRDRMGILSQNHGGGRRQTGIWMGTWTLNAPTSSKWQEHYPES